MKVRLHRARKKLRRALEDLLGRSGDDERASEDLMKAERGFDREGGGESDRLRALLREWRSPGLPPEIEDDLRRTFRRGRGKRQLVWLALAASVALVLLLLATRGDRPATPVVVERTPPAAAAPEPLSPLPAVEKTVEKTVETRAEAGEVARPRRARRAERVVVEPGQAALLALFARELRGARFAPPAGAPPPIVAAPHGARPGPILRLRRTMCSCCTVPSGRGSRRSGRSCTARCRSPWRQRP